MQKDHPKTPPASQNGWSVPDESSLKALNLEQLQKLLAKVKKFEEQIQTRIADKVEERLDQNRCVVCMDKSRSVVIIPCFHMILCDTCANRLTNSSGVCPQCRGIIKELKKVYV
eukprot:TRINITY_DN5372_c0_g1_i1.p1 TRINITY_DN5372_c0_g1~~TRINITY_DN5372_c0_g1_i1.p1  ORF type:complete len:114 (+),score=21.76 TRINITY_DN5372_c0_g1_i1:251-592(+)